ncbi:Kynurenine formamidase [Ciborinia camelliae]|nr:Kynurenine formamidase [Ciborinia camelliae]
MATIEDSSLDAASNLLREDVKYAQEHDLQTLSIYSARHHEDVKPLTGAISKPTTNSSKIRVIYIHGGAWRDPLVTSSSILPTINRLLSSSIECKIASFVSINYRLSSHPSFPQDSSSVPKHTYRNAKHPDHIWDVCSALSYLQSKHSIEDQYLLVGHSCGATLAMQILMGKEFLHSCGIPYESLDFKLPRYVLGVAGIYDLRLLRDTHSHPAYNEFLTEAFGSNEKVWDEVSPARFSNFDEFGKSGKVLAFATSRNDELVDEEQIDVMMRNVQDIDGGVVVKNLKNMLKGAHNEIWETGDLADAIDEILHLSN